MLEDDFQVFGDVRSPGGAILASSGIEGTKKSFAFIAREHLKMRGMAITEEVERVVQEFAASQVKELVAEIEARGVPDYLAQLFAITRKRDAQKHIREITISREEFVALIHNAGHLGFSHRLIRRQFVPEHLHLTDRDLKAVRERSRGVLTDGAKSALRKLRSTLNERKVNHCHLFERGEEWHAFSFSYEDMQADERQHWVHGSHVHYLSHLWGTVGKEELLKSFEGRRGVDWGREHIRFEER